MSEDAQEVAKATDQVEQNQQDTAKVLTPITRPTIRSEVATKLTARAPDVKEAIVEHLVKAQLDKRVEATLKVIAKIDEVEKELKKLERGDVETFDSEGKLVAATFTKARAEELKKAREKKQKLDKALEAALNDSNFDKLFELANQN